MNKRILAVIGGLALLAPTIASSLSRGGGEVTYEVTSVGPADTNIVIAALPKGASNVSVTLRADLDEVFTVIHTPNTAGVDGVLDVRTDGAQEDDEDPLAPVEISVHFPDLRIPTMVSGVSSEGHFDGWSMEQGAFQVALETFGTPVEEQQVTPWGEDIICKVRFDTPYTDTSVNVSPSTTFFDTVQRAVITVTWD